MAYDSSSFNYSDPQMQYTVDHSSQLEPQRTRPRAPSTHRAGDAETTRLPAQPRQPPLSEAVSSAFDKADMTDYVPPELIAQITEKVIKQLKTSGIESTTPVTQTNKPFPPPSLPIHQPVPLSPSTLSGSPPLMHTRGVYTPPSPQRHSDYGRFESPDLLLRDQTPPFHHKERRGSSPISQSGESGYLRPKGPTRLSTGRDETTLEKIWGQLFDEESNPTPRLGQFLRGLAVHIIEDYEPCHSIVITPSKMKKYYEDVKLQNEAYPWHAIFDDEKSSISRMYRELFCQHHLVQERDDEKPAIPGLTPVGFERWVTLFIQAHPDEEYERLQKAVRDLPISNPDEKERFPKEISRRLFPTTGDRKVCQRLDDAISEHANVQLHKRTKRDGSPTQTASTAAEPAYVPPTYRRQPSLNVETKVASNFHPSPLERERAPYSNTPSESAIDDKKPFAPPSQPIERERKPYSAVPGVGKAFEDDARVGKPRSESTAARIGRSNSLAKPRAAPPCGNSTRPMEVPKPEIHNPNRVNSNARQHRSPSFCRGSDGFRRSDSDLRGFPTPFQGSSAAHVEVVDDDHRRYIQERAERSRRQVEDEARAYGESANARARYDREPDANKPYKGSYGNADEEYYRNSGRGGSGYDYAQPPYRGSGYR